MGIHLHGGHVNSGYSASFIYSMLLHNAKMKAEDSEEWLTSLKQHGLQIVEDPEWQDLDESRIRVNGRYHIVDRQTLNKVYGFSKTAARQRQFEDPECVSPSGEAKPTSSGALSVAAVLSPSIEGELQHLTVHELRSLEKLLQARRKELLGLEPSTKA